MSEFDGNNILIKDVMSSCLNESTDGH